MMRSFNLCRAVALLALSFVAGCAGGDGPPREPVVGVVTLDGKPLEKGLITFTPANGGDLVVSGLIVDGAFSIPRAEGPGLGPHRVDVWSKKATGKVKKDRYDPDNPVEETVDLVPTRYNLRSELKADVVQGGDNRFAYDLSGTRDKEPVKKLASRRP